MPPRKQNERSLHEIEMEEIRRQIQLLQETVNAQRTLLEAQRRRNDDNDDPWTTNSWYTQSSL